MTAALKNPNSLEARARQALTLAKKMEPIKLQLEAHKVQFRQDAGGSGLKIPVKGLGEVSISKASKAGTKLVIHEDILDQNPALRQQMFEAGIVTYEPTAARAAQVTFRLNV